MLHDKIIQADCCTLLDQASATVATYMTRAVAAIDGEFGKGYARNNPALVAAFMQVAGQDFVASVSLKVAENLAEHLGEKLENVGDSIVAAAEKVCLSMDNMN